MSTSGTQVSDVIDYDTVLDNIGISDEYHDLLKDNGLLNLDNIYIYILGCQHNYGNNANDKNRYIANVRVIYYFINEFNVQYIRSRFELLHKYYKLLLNNKILLKVNNSNTKPYNFCIDTNLRLKLLANDELETNNIVNLGSILSGNIDEQTCLDSNRALLCFLKDKYSISITDYLNRPVNDYDIPNDIPKKISGDIFQFYYLYFASMYVCLNKEMNHKELLESYYERIRDNGDSYIESYEDYVMTAINVIIEKSNHFLYIKDDEKKDRPKSYIESAIGYTGQSVFGLNIYDDLDEIRYKSKIEDNKQIELKKDELNYIDITDKDNFYKYNYPSKYLFDIYVVNTTSEPIGGLYTDILKSNIKLMKEKRCYIHPTLIKKYEEEDEGKYNWKYGTLYSGKRIRKTVIRKMLREILIFLGDQNLEYEAPGGKIIKFDIEDFKFCKNKNLDIYEFLTYYRSHPLIEIVYDIVYEKYSKKDINLFDKLPNELYKELEDEYYNIYKNININFDIFANFIKILKLCKGREYVENFVKTYLDLVFGGEDTSVGQMVFVKEFKLSIGSKYMKNEENTRFISVGQMVLVKAFEPSILLKYLKSKNETSVLKDGTQYDQTLKILDTIIEVDETFKNVNIPTYIPTTIIGNTVKNIIKIARKNKGIFNPNSTYNIKPEDVNNRGIYICNFIRELNSFSTSEDKYKILMRILSLYRQQQKIESDKWVDILYDIFNNKKCGEFGIGIKDHKYTTNRNNITRFMFKDIGQVKFYNLVDEILNRLDNGITKNNGNNIEIGKQIINYFVAKNYPLSQNNKVKIQNMKSKLDKLREVNNKINILFDTYSKEIQDNILKNIYSNEHIPIDKICDNIDEDDTNNPIIQIINNWKQTDKTYSSLKNMVYKILDFMIKNIQPQLCKKQPKSCPNIYINEINYLFKCVYNSDNYKNIVMDNMIYYTKDIEEDTSNYIFSIISNCDFNNVVEPFIKYLVENQDENQLYILLLYSYSHKHNQDKLTKTITNILKTKEVPYTILFKIGIFEPSIIIKFILKNYINYEILNPSNVENKQDFNRYVHRNTKVFRDIILLVKNLKEFYESYESYNLQKLPYHNAQSISMNKISEYCLFGEECNFIINFDIEGYNFKDFTDFMDKIRDNIQIKTKSVEDMFDTYYKLQSYALTISDKVRDIAYIGYDKLYNIITADTLTIIGENYKISNFKNSNRQEIQIQGKLPDFAKRDTLNMLDKNNIEMRKIRSLLLNNIIESGDTTFLNKLYTNYEKLFNDYKNIINKYQRQIQPVFNNN